jgi:hypothetical protein
LHPLKQESNIRKGTTTAVTAESKDEHSELSKTIKTEASSAEDKQGFRASHLITI